MMDDAFLVIGAWGCVCSTTIFLMPLVLSMWVWAAVTIVDCRRHAWCPRVPLVLPLCIINLCHPAHAVLHFQSYDCKPLTWVLRLAQLFGVSYKNSDLQITPIKSCFWCYFKLFQIFSYNFSPCYESLSFCFLSPLKRWPCFLIGAL